MIKVTIAIPVYNDEQYIERCIDSVLNQTLGQEYIEIVCIDDGSTDDSGKILDRYARQHANIYVGHQENSGSPSGPRNRAIELANGEYIYFVDSDDFLGEEALERMLEVGEKYDCDIVVGKYKGVNRGVPQAIFRRNPEFFTFFGSNAMNSISALKMFKTSLLRNDNIRFLEGTNIGEDHIVTALAYICSKKIGLVKNYDCYYSVHSEEGNRVQLTKQERPFPKVLFFIQETLKAIHSLNKDEEVIKKGLYHYWTRLLNFEMMYEANKQTAMREKIKNFQKFSLLAREYHPDHYFSLFSPADKVKFRMLEKECIDDFFDYVSYERHQKDLKIHQGELYPVNQLAYRTALDEGVSFTKANRFVGTIISADITDGNLLLEGHQYHSRLSPASQVLSLKISNRESGEVYLVRADEGLFFHTEAFPILDVPEGKEHHQYFHAKVELSFLEKGMELAYLDFHLMADVKGYRIETRLKTSDPYFVQTYHLLYNLDSSVFMEVTPYETVHKNFSVKARKLEEVREGLSVTKAVFQMDGDRLIVRINLRTKYSRFVESLNRIQLDSDGFLMVGRVIAAFSKRDELVVQSEFFLGLAEKKRVRRFKELSLLMDQIRLPIIGLKWEK